MASDAAQAKAGKPFDVAVLGGGIGEFTLLIL